MLGMKQKEECRFHLVHLRDPLTILGDSVGTFASSIASSLFSDPHYIHPISFDSEDRRPLRGLFVEELRRKKLHFEGM